MKVIDFFVISYFSIFKKYGLKGLEAGIFSLFFPLTFNIIALLLYLLHFFKSGNEHVISPVILFALWILIAFALRNLLNKIYLDKLEYIEKLSCNFPRILLIFIPIIHYPLSVFFAVYCLKFM